MDFGKSLPLSAQSYAAPVSDTARYLPEMRVPEKFYLGWQHVHPKYYIS